jgi:hypothetical protein
LTLFLNHDPPTPAVSKFNHDCSPNTALHAMYAADVPAAARQGARVVERGVTGDATGGNVRGGEGGRGAGEKLYLLGNGGQAVVMVARTLRDVGEGEELCIDYLSAGEEGGLQDQAGWRREQLLERYGFVTTCSCVGCSA